MESMTDQQMIQQAFQQLLGSLDKTVSAEEKELIKQAFQEASTLYEGKMLASGKPMIMHYLEVARIAVVEIGLRTSTVIAALLHGMEVSGYEKSVQLETRYNKDVSIIIKGFRKISELPTERLSFHSDQFRKLFLSLIEDIRVILLKVAHRLYDLRSPEDSNGKKIEKFILEVKHFYIPITHRLGLYSIKAEFEERVMRFENPSMFDSISEKIKASKDKQDLFMSHLIQPIEEQLKEQGLDCSIKWRTKSIPSIWAKMRDQNVDFEQVYDLFAMRIITRSSPKKEKEDCWRVYSIVTNLYSPNPKRLRDWITTPKASGYESLHTTLKAPDDKWVEVQIRSERMDIVAEKGQAAHWMYKEQQGKKEAEDWLNQVRDVLDNPDQIRFDSYKRKQNQYDKIFIFTPNGDLKQLNGGSTVLDFAYEVHTQVGSTCNGARVNNRIVPIRHVLQNGDKVEILTSKKQSPKHDWLGFVNTDRAKSKIKRYLKEEELKEAEIGKGLLLRKLKNWKITYSDDIINHLVKYYKTSSSVQLYHMIATEKLNLVELKKHLVSLSSDEKVSARHEQTEQPQEVKHSLKSDSKDDFLLIDDNISNVNFKLAKCCNPIPGDDVFGFVTINTGITIHRTSCPNALRLKTRYGYRFLKVKWKEAKDNPTFQAAIRVVGQDTLGLVGEITKLISNDLKVIMRSISFDSRDGRFNGKILLQIKDTDHLDQLIHRISKVQGVERVTRID
ncbi:MAG: RelA/SpoT family protein [Bacteroidetes bacterium HGW-Bacteroidetes-1]|jgi:GTP pyrophosphokinase|nr:MAG: RelA/SpoT family protein [Bacteroidetes bacterium HGW-Bacteroidetes-1]